LYAIGDIHGERGMLEELLASLPLLSDDRLIFVGDYVDRGPDSKGVVDVLIQVAKTRKCIFLIGNHESMFLDFLGWEGSMYFAGDAFLANGGDRTLMSYDFFGSEDSDSMEFSLPKAHEEFFRKLVLYHTEGDYVFVHAGLSRAGFDSGDVDYALRNAVPEDLLWNRSTGDIPHKLGVTVIYGHTPAKGLDIRWNSPFSIGIDTGAVYGGKLTAIRLPDETIFQV
jgi:serine/threonine protein phosphatase 1